jgi:hypothetical protein
MSFALSQVSILSVIMFSLDFKFVMRKLTPSFVHYSSSAPRDWVNYGLCGEWAHFGCDRRQGLGTLKVKLVDPLTHTS